MINSNLAVYNSLTGKKETFDSIVPDRIGMYVCGPTVYSEAHLGNCRTFVNFDVIYRYLLYLGYKVRYVRNITDVGHLLDDGEDRILKGARLEQLEPMEVVQKYANGFHVLMDKFNTLKPSIEPRATGHIIEQIEMIKDILENGLAYIKNGSVYFNTLKFAEEHKSYGQLSGRIIEDLHAESRDDLKNQGEKNHPSDFAIWIKAGEDHIMKWPSPWSVGFPGWHLECSAMSTKYLGTQFDIHGGGNDLKFPHHENEIAQNVGACGCTPARYWLHANMLLLNGKKMSKSDGNTISAFELFSGNSVHVTKGFTPMVVRFFMLQSHYRSTLDLTDHALHAADKGFKRLMEANRYLPKATGSDKVINADLEEEVRKIIQSAHDDMNDDFNTPKALSRLFELVPIINSHRDAKSEKSTLSNEILDVLRKAFEDFIYTIFGLMDDLDVQGTGSNGYLNGLMELIINLRQNARENKDWPTSDKIRDTLNELEIKLMDGKEGTSWTI